uniref:Protein kinase domain-containing protein n=1 Tax=Arundo donax TaxID=35708 RepID=A0A0A9DC69_ARUDO
MLVNVNAEYGMSEEISTKGDVYSFGMLLLEMITGSSPTDEKFNDGTNLHGFVDRAFPEKIHEIIDPVMLQEEFDAGEVLQNCIVPLARIGLSCSMTLPKERPGNPSYLRPPAPLPPERRRQRATWTTPLRRSQISACTPVRQRRRYPTQSRIDPCRDTAVPKRTSSAAAAHRAIGIRRKAWSGTTATQTGHLELVH